VETRTLDEVIALYDLEPTLTDIYVEGESDRCFISWFLGETSKPNVRVYTIDTVDIPESIVVKHKLLTHSMRSKVLALAAELGSQLKSNRNVLCIADRDYEDYLSANVSSPMLEFTDGNSLECYAFTDANFRKFSLVVLGEEELTLLGLSTTIGKILRRVYLTRLANEVLGWGMKGIPFTRYVELSGGAISFHEDRFVRAYLQKNKRWADRAKFTETKQSLSSSLSGDIRRATRGHDIADLLLHILHKISPERKFGNPQTLEGALLGTIESKYLEKTTLFKRIMAL
jgi:hypothetical protein